MRSRAIVFGVTGVLFSAAVSAQPRPPAQTATQTVTTAPPATTTTTLPPPPPGAAPQVQAAPAQTALDLPPPPPTEEESDRALIDQASDMIARGRPADARRLLDARLTLDGRPAYSALPVLQRLATRMAPRVPVAQAPIETPEPTRPPPPVGNDRRSDLEAVELYGTALAYGASTGIWLDVLVEVDDAKTAIWLPIGGAGLGVLGAWALDGSGHPVRPGFATAVNTGFQLGLGAGFSLGVELEENLRETFDCGGFPCSRRTFREKELFTTMWAGATIGIGVGAATSLLAHSSPGSGSYVYMGGLWGSALGLMVVGQTDETKHFGLGALIGGTVGIVATLATAGIAQPTQARVGWTHLGVLAGGLLGVGVAVLVFENDRGIVGPLLAVEVGMVGGGIAGWFLGAPSSGTAPRVARSSNRFRVEPAVTPVPGGVTFGFNLPALL